MERALLIAPSDLGELSTFALRERWTDARNALLSADELPRIRPLRREKANDIWRVSLETTARDRDSDVDERYFEPAERISSVSRETLAWLKSRMPRGRAPILVSWQPELAVFTDSELFLAHWQEFCYPGSDDVSVLPLDTSWVLHFWHEEEFLYAKRRAD